MKWALRIMRAMIILLVVFFVLDYGFKWNLFKSLLLYIFIFAIIYLFTSMTNMMIRFKSQYKYAYRSRREHECKPCPPEADRDETTEETEK